MARRTATSSRRKINPSRNGRHLDSPFGGFVDPIATNNMATMVNNITATSRNELVSSSADPRRSVEDECGYPPPNAAIGVDLYRHLFDRCEIANRAVQLMGKECWKDTPSVYETEDTEDVTQFEMDWDNLGASLNVGRSWYASEEGSRVWEYLSRVDTLSRIGSFGLLLIGIDDGKNLQEPVDDLMTINWKESPVYKMVFNHKTKKQEKKMVGLKRHSPTYAPVQQDSPIRKHEVAALRQPKPQKLWERYDRDKKQHVYKEYVPPVLNEEEEVTLNSWLASNNKIEQTRNHAKQLIQQGMYHHAADLVVNSGISGPVLGFTPEERKAIGLGYTDLVTNAVPPPRPNQPQRQPLEPNNTFPAERQPTPQVPVRGGVQGQPGSPQQSPPNSRPQQPSPIPQGHPASPGQPVPTSTRPGQKDPVPQPVQGPPQAGQGKPQQSAQHPTSIQPRLDPTLRSQPPTSPLPPRTTDRTNPNETKQQPMNGLPNRGPSQTTPQGVKQGSAQPQGTDRQYGTSDGAMSSGYGMTPASYQNTMGNDGTALGQPNLTYGGRMSGTDQQYYGVQLGPTELPPTDVAGGPPRKIIFLRPYDESLVQVVRYEWNINNPRFGLPVMYRITLNDPREVHSGIGLPLATVFVHWSRVLHIADINANAGSSEIFAAPILRPILNRCLDCYKLPSAAAEGYWQSGTPTKVFETHPQLGGDVLLDSDDVRDQVEYAINSLIKVLIGRGGSWKLLAPSMTDPSPFIQTQIELICIQLGVPVRIFKGAERGELASSQDDGNWNSRVKGRQHGYITPRIICPFVDRMIMLRVLSQPTTYYVDWPDIESMTDTEKAGIFAQLVGALGAYMQTGASQYITPRDLLVQFTMGLFTEEEVDAMLAAAEEFQEEAMQMQADQLAQQQALAEQAGYEVAPLEGMVDPEQQERDHEVAMAQAENPPEVGAGGGGGFPPKKGGFPPKGSGGFPPKGGAAGGPPKPGGGFPPKPGGPPTGGGFPPKIPQATTQPMGKPLQPGTPKSGGGKPPFPPR